MEYRWLHNFHFKTIIDIGANEGQFSDKMRILFPEAEIFAFEPLPEVFERLKSNFSRDDRHLVQVAPCRGGGGSIFIHQASESGLHLSCSVYAPPTVLSERES